MMSTFRKFSSVVGAIIILLVAAYFAVFHVFRPSLKEVVFPPEMPKRVAIKKAVWLNQNWSEHDRYWFHHATQGTSTIPMPYDWFVSLEAPEFVIFDQPPLLSDPGYLARLGFISSPATWERDSYGYKRDELPAYGGASDAQYSWADYPKNKDALPVGFARTKGYKDPITGKQVPDQLGFNCAACHTGHFNYKGVSVRIDGAPAMTDLGKFRRAMVVSLLYAAYVPGRLERFARRVYARQRDKLKGIEFEDFKAGLKAKLKKAFHDARILKQHEYEIEARRCKAMKASGAKHSCHDEPEGFGRLDALNRIGNQVFFKNLHDPENPDPKVDGNRAPLNAPVSFPPIWSVPWFSWAQYDASIRQPMIRNGGEALGVSARINLRDPKRPLYASSVQFKDLIAMEALLEGANPFEGPQPGFRGLQAPNWPSHLFPDDPAWQLDAKKVAAGRVVYDEVCAGCHLPPVDDSEFWSSKHWKSVAGGPRKYLNQWEIPLAKLGTDSSQSDVLHQRTVYAPKHLKIDPGTLLARCNQTASGIKPGVQETMPFSLALMAVTENTVKNWMDSENLSADARSKIWGDRNNCANNKLLKGKQHYRARPLNGVWATAPYLHNGSVPNLWALLSPDKERPHEIFCVGSREFDPKKVGYKTKCDKGMFKFDTKKPGNSNAGHRFTAEKSKKDGFPERKLTEDERWALMEYLKTL